MTPSGFRGGVLTLSGLLLLALGSPQPSLGEGFPWTANIGAGFNVPLGRTAQITHLGAAFDAGFGYRFGRKQSVLLQYYFSSMPFNRSTLGPLGFFKPSSNLYSFTINYKREFRFSRATHPYFIGGSGWYRRLATITRPSIAGDIACSSALSWWNLACQAGFVPTDKVVAAANSDVVGYNAGAGLSRRIRSSSARWYVEIRYHYAPYPGVPQRAVPFVAGLTW
jgi:hypothetical protein